MTSRTNDKPNAVPDKRPAVKLYDPWEIRFKKHYEPVRLESPPTNDEETEGSSDQSAA